VWLNNSYIEQVFNSYPLIKNKLTVESVGKILGKSNGMGMNNYSHLSSKSALSIILRPMEVMERPMMVLISITK
jgi:hypothetical protein